MSKEEDFQRVTDWLDSESAYQSSEQNSRHTGRSYTKSKSRFSVQQYSEQTRAESSFAVEQSDDYYEESEPGDDVLIDHVSIDMAD